MQKIMGSAIMQILIRSANGVMAVTLYFADIVSDVQVVQLLCAGSKARPPLKTVFVESGRSQMLPSSARVFRLNLQVQLDASLLSNDFIVDAKLVVTNGVALEIDHYNRFA